MNDSKITASLKAHYSMDDNSWKRNPGALCITCRQFNWSKSVPSSTILVVYITLGREEPSKSDKFQKLSKTCELFTYWVLTSLPLELSESQLASLWDRIFRFRGNCYTRDCPISSVDTLTTFVQKSMTVTCGFIFRLWNLLSTCILTCRPISWSFHLLVFDFFHQHSFHCRGLSPPWLNLFLGLVFFNYYKWDSFLDFFFR